MLRHVVLHLYVTAESHYLVANGMFETEHDGHRDNHYRQSDGHSDGGYADSRAADLTALTFGTVDAAGNE